MSKTIAAVPKVYLINRTSGNREIPVTHSDGSKDFIFVQGGSKAVVPQGYTVCPEFLAVNKLDFEVKTAG